MQAVYNQLCGGSGWATCQILSDRRKTQMRNRWKNEFGRSIDTWREICGQAAASDFLCGRVQRGQGHETWEPDIDFLLQPKSLTKLLEGKYDNRPSNGRDGNGKWDVLRSP